MEVNILTEREQVYRGSGTPLEKIVEIPKEREVVYYKSSDPKADCDNFVDMYEEDYVLEDEVGINLPSVSKCPTKYFAVENLFGELEHVYQKEKAQENLGIKDTLENLKENLSKVSSILKFDGIQNESVLLQQGVGNEIIFYTIENKFISKTGNNYYQNVPKEYVELTINKIYIYDSQTYIYNGITLVSTTKQLHSDLKLLQESVAKHNKCISFYNIEPVTVIIDGEETTYSPNQTHTVFVGDSDFEIITTSNSSIIQLLDYPIPLTWKDWLEGVAVFSNIIFDMNELETYSKWNQYNQGEYNVQKAQYINCVFWSDKPYTHSPFEERTNYTLYYTAQLPLCYATIPENTYKPFYFAYGVKTDPNWNNPKYVNSFGSLKSGAPQTFSYYGASSIGIFNYAVDIITLCKDCRGLMYDSPAIKYAGVFDAINTTNFGAKKGSWQDAFGKCYSLEYLYIQNLKTSINISWSPVNIQSIQFIIDKAANTSKIYIYVSPYTWYRLTDDIKSAATSKNIAITLLEGNYSDDKRLSTIQLTGSGGKFLSDSGEYKSINYDSQIQFLQNQILILQKQALTDIVISEGTIQEQQYQGYKVLKSADVTVTSIGNFAFKDCVQLETFICRTTTPPSLGSDVFTNTNLQLAIYVPTNNLDTYKTNWSDYKDIIVPMNYYTTLGIFPYTGTFIESEFLQLYAKKEGKNVEVTWEIISGLGTITNEGILKPGSSSSPITVRATMKDGTYLESTYTPGASEINELEE